MPYRFNAITGKLDLVEIIQVEAGITALGSDDGTVAPVAGLVNILGDAGQGSTTSGTANDITVTNTSATEGQVGVSALASDAETIDGTVANKAIVPTSLKAKLGTQTAEGIPFGQGDDSTINWTDSLTDGQLVIGATGSSPTASTLTGGTGITIVNAANSITINAEAETDLIFQTGNGSTQAINDTIIFAGATSIDMSAAGGIVNIDFNVDDSPEIATSYSTDAGIAVPIDNEMILAGDQLGIHTSALNDRIQINFDVTALPTIPVAFATDDGVAQPNENVLDLVGGNNISVTALGSEVIFDFTGEPTELTFSADVGSALAVNDIINIIGSPAGIVTSASTDTIIIDFDVTQSPEICTRFLTDFGNAIPNNNDISFTGSPDISVTATGSIVSIGFTGDPADLQFTTNAGVAISTQGNINFNGTQGITTAASNDTVILGFDVSQQPEIVTSLVGDSGFALPFDNNINLFTGPGLSTQGASSTISFNFHVDQLPAIPTEFIVDSGSSAVPVGNALKIEGGNDIVTSSVGDVVLISFNGSVEDLTFNTNNGTAQADSGIINVLGGSPEGVITTRGFNDNIFIDFNPNFFPEIPVQFTGDIGNAIPADNNLNIVGGSNIIVQGIDDTLTINFTGEGTGLTFGSDSGNSEPDVNGLINFFGTPSGIGTFASGNAIGFSFDINGQPTIPNQFQTDAGNATPTFNSLKIFGGNNIQTVASNDSVTINFTGSPEVLDYGTDNGVARAENGVINFFGSTGGIDTFAIGNAIGIDFDVNEVPIIATTYISDSGNASPTFNELIISGGNNIQTSASGKTVTINVGPEIQEQLNAIFAGLKSIHDSGIDLPLETQQWILKNVV